jgi:hypothetical protein
MKVFFTSLIFFLILLVNTRSYAAETYEVTSDVFVRSGIGTSYEAMGVAKTGDQVIVLDKSNPNWFKIEFEEKVGYISSKYLKINEQPVSKPIEDSNGEGEKSYPGAGLLILFLALFLIFEISRRRRNKRIATSISNFQNSHPELTPEAKKKSPINKVLLNRAPGSMRDEARNMLKTESNKEDDSILDVTREFSISEPIPKKDIGPFLVPSWSHKYVYSKSDLFSATKEQKVFYNHFKQKFLAGTSLDLMGNTNYAFVLLFDLLNDYKSHKNIQLLESQITNLGNNYYKTRSYGIRFLNDIKKELGLIPGLVSNYAGQRVEIRPEEESYYDSVPDYVYWKVGSKYKVKLGLKDEEVALLNKLWESTSNFCNIEFCYFQVIKLYLLVVSTFKAQCERDESSLEEEFLSLSDLIARKHFRYRKGSSNYKMSIRNTSDEFYTAIFKLCENAVREQYGHKRKLNTDPYYTDPEITMEFHARITAPFSALISTNILSVLNTDEETEKELNSLTTSRWKDAFQRICADFSADEKMFIEAIIKLGDLNTKNPSIENIFYEASKFIASKHKESSLILYMHYLHHDLKSVKFDNKQLTKTIQRNLFNTQEQVEQFGTIVNDLLEDQSLEKAVTAVSQLYAVKRKRIKLDRNSIEEVRQQHAGTVELLNEYLQEEEEENAVEFKKEIPETEEIEIHINPVQWEKSKSLFLEEIQFKPIHFSVLELFAKSNLSIALCDFELFARANGVFRNQLIESINEVCYDVLDDVLIEEDEDFYTIEVSYFHTITTEGS